MQNQSHIRGRGLPISRAPLVTEIFKHLLMLKHNWLMSCNVHLSGQNVLNRVGVHCSRGDGGGPLVVNLVDMFVDLLVVEKSRKGLD